MESSSRNRVVLGGILALVALYTYQAVLISPMHAECARLQSEMEASDRSMRIVAGELRQLRGLERAALDDADKDSLAHRLLEATPQAYRVEYPRLIKQLLHGHTISVPKLNLFLLQPFRGVPDRAVAVWKIEIDEASALNFGEALADLENQFSLTSVTELSLTANGAAGTVKILMYLQTAVRP